GVLDGGEACEGREAWRVLGKRGADPAKEHSPVLPSTNVAAEAYDRAVEILDRVRAPQRAIQRSGDTELLKREGLFEPLAQRSCGSWMLALERTREPLKLATGELGIGGLVRLPHRPRPPRGPRLPEMTGHLAGLMNVAAMDDAELPEELRDRLADPLAPVDHEDARLLDAESTLDQVSEKSLCDDGVLGASLAQPKDPLGPVGSDSQSHEHAVVAEEDSVDDHHADVEVIERLGEPPGEHRGTHCHQPPRHRTLRYRPLDLPGRQRIERASVLPCRHSDRDRLQRPRVERVTACSKLEARKPKLLPV